MLAVASLLCAPGTVSAAVLSAHDISGVATVGALAGQGERSWLRRGLGKLRTDDGASAGGDLVVAWTPSVSNWVGAVVSLQAQSVPEGVVSLNESYLHLRPDPAAPIRVSGRIGMFYPPISLEHDGPEWSLVHTLDASAINSWVAEEVKTAGVEAKVRTVLAGRPVSVTAAAFQGNDTSGALLFFRGWALHDIRAGLNTRLPLPPTQSLFAGVQATDTRAVAEVDGRWGGYARFDLEPSTNTLVSLFVFDSNGRPTAIQRGQYAWRTRFVQLSARWRSPSGAALVAQAMNGESDMGGLAGGLRPASIGFASAFVLYSTPVGISAVSARADYFAISDRTFKSVDNNAERGWALTTSWSRPLSPRTQAITEAVVSRSVRPDRARFHEAARQTQVQLRAAMKFVF
jgi:hypothetical protein